MILQSVTVENFRCFESLKIGFESDVNVIVGVNGAGKTALLDAIAIALCEVAIPPISSSYYVSSKNSKTYHAKDYGKAFCTNDDIYIAPYARDSFSERKEFVQISTSALLSNQEFSWTQKLQAGINNFFTLQNNVCELTSIRQYMKDLWMSVKTDIKHPIPVEVYYLAQRRLAKTPPLENIFDVKIERLAAFYNALHAGVDYQMACQWFYLRENAELRERMNRDDMQFQYPDLKSVRKALGSTIEGLERIYFDNSTPPRLMVNVRKIQENKADSIEILALDQLSDGYRNMIALVIDYARRLAMANPYVDNPLEVPGVLIIDEIELHLHPRWQQTIIPNLRNAFPNTQILVTTHSPQVLTSVKNRSIRILKDYQIFTTDEYTLGAEAKLPLERILGTNSRPPDSPAGKIIETVFDLINRDQLDEAEKLINENEKIKESEPALIEAESLISCRRWEKELQL